MSEGNLDKVEFDVKGVIIRVRARTEPTLSEQVANTLSGAAIQAASGLGFVCNKIVEAAMAVYGLLQDMWKKMEPALQDFACDVSSVADSIQNTKTYGAVSRFVSRHVFLLGIVAPAALVLIPARVALDCAAEYVAAKLFEICREWQKIALFNTLDVSYITDEMLFAAMKVEFANTMKIAFSIGTALAGAAVVTAGILEMMGKTDEEVLKAL